MTPLKHSKRVWEKTYKGDISYAILICLLLLSALLKNDLSSISNSRFWSQLAIPNYLVAIKENYLMLLFGSLIIGLYKATQIRNAIGAISAVAVMYFILSVMMIYRSFFEDKDLSSKLVQSLLITIFIYIITAAAVSSRGIGKYKRYFVNAVLTASLLFVALNAIIAITGYGYVPGNPRFFGASSHPNFIGVQLAICNVLLLFGSIKSKKNIYKILTFTLFGVGIYLQFLSGSRTAFLMLGAALLIILLCWRQYKIDIWLVGSTTVFIGALTYVTLFSNVESLQRGDDKFGTRDEAWSWMLTTSLESPIFGQGKFIGFSENSYLRLAVAFGIPVFLIFLSMCGWCLYRLFKRSSGSIKNFQSADHFILAIFVALLTGAIFEGFLLDSWSFPKVIFIMLLAMSFPSMHFARIKQPRKPISNMLPNEKIKEPENRSLP